MDLVAICDMQDEIIEAQSGIIDSLFARLSQVLTVQEMDAMPELEAMQDVVKRRKEL